MPVSRLNGVGIAWDHHGDERRPAIVLIQGLGMPAAAWPPAFIERLIQGGFSVVTFDNRDVGASEYLGGTRDSGVLRSALRRMAGLEISAPYGLSDMAGDALALLDELALDTAHVVGFSMGGMIAQRLALAAPHRVSSLTSVMSTTNDPDLPQPSLGLQWFLATGGGATTPRERRAYLRRFWKRIGSPAFPHSEAELEAFIERILAAGMPPAGRDRQTLAIIAEKGRSAELSRLRLPTLVIHGTDDPLVPVECGQRTAESIPDARLKLIEGMGHDLPVSLLAEVGNAIVSHAADAGITRRDEERAA